MRSHLPHLYEFGPFRLDTAERLLLRNGQRVPLTPKVFETLVALVEHRGRLIEKDRLMEFVWPDSFVEEANLTNNISTLRKTLGEGENGQTYIETVPKTGYRFTAEVRELPSMVTELVVEKHSLTRIETEEREIETESDAVVSESSPIRATSSEAAARVARQLRGALVVVALLVVGAAVALAIFWLMTRRQPGDAVIGAIPFREMEISRLTTSGNVMHAAISPDGRYVAHVTRDAEGDSLWVRQVAAPSSVRVAGPATTEYVAVAFAPDGDSVYYVTVDRDKGHTALYRVPVLGGPSSLAARDVGSVGFSPDGKHMAFIRKVDDRSHLLIADIDGTNERTLATRRQPDLFWGYWNAPAWSSDGKTIACQVRLNDELGQYETVIGVSVTDGAQTPLTSKRWSHVGQPGWLGDGSGLLLTASESEPGPVQVWHIARKSGQTTRITNDLNDYHDITLTSDSSRVAAVQDQSVSSIWVAPDADANRAKQIASEVAWIRELAWTPEGRIIYRSNAGGSAELWMMNADGSNQKQLTSGAHASRGLDVSPDGRYITFSSDRAGRFNLWRVDSDGGNLKQLTNADDDFYPHCSLDGQWVVFQRGVMEPRLWRVPIGGGEPEQLTKTRAVWPDISPDGQKIVYYFLDPEVGESHWRIGIVSARGGSPLQRFDLPPTVAPAGRFVRWSPDRQSIAFVNNSNGLSDIWLQPLNGSQPKQLTNFRAEQIIAFDWSGDGRSLAVVRGVETSDVVLIDHKKK